MSGESVLYGLIAGIAIVLLGIAFRPRDGSRRITGDERVRNVGWSLLALFFILVLQLVGVGQAFAIVCGFAAALVVMYLVGRRALHKPIR